MGGHTTPGMNLYQSQNFWDATMSYSIAEAMKQQKESRGVPDERPLP